MFNLLVGGIFGVVYVFGMAVLCYSAVWGIHFGIACIVDAIISRDKDQW